MRLSLVLFAFCLVFAALPARADYVVWQDDAAGVSLSWPDTWRQVSNQAPDDILTLMAPSGRAHAMCRLRARADGRYALYPGGYDWAVQRVGYNRAFWDRYLGAYDDAQIRMVQDGAGLGRGFAGYAVASYSNAVPGPFMDRKALMFAALYRGTAYILECSAHEGAFADWKGPFLSIAGSVDFKKKGHETAIGHYRNFMRDPRIEFIGDEGRNRVLY